MALGIVIEGGGLRGAFAVGVLERLHTLGKSGALGPLSASLVRPEHLFATSSGAPNAAYLATGQIDDAIHIWGRHTHGTQLIDFGNLVRPAPVMKVDTLVDVIRRGSEGGEPLRVQALDEAGAPGLHISVTDVGSGANRVLRASADNIFDLLTAAMSVPFVYGEVVAVRGQSGEGYIDGGFGAPVAIREALALGLDKIVVVLTKPEGHRRRPNRPIEWLLGRSFPTYPNARRAIGEKWHHYNETMDLLDVLEREGRAWIVRPREGLPVARLSRSKARIMASIELGRVAVEERRDSLRAYLGAG